jgi:hypothetical protein
MSASNLHGRILNLPGAGGLSEIGTTHGEQLAYRRGHSDARHAAAELAIEADSLIDELAGSLDELIYELIDFACIGTPTRRRALAALAKAKGEAA